MEQVFLCLLPLLPIALKFSTLLYFISLLSEYRNIAQGGDPTNGDVDWERCSGAQIDKRVCFLSNLTSANDQEKVYYLLV